MGQIQKEMIKLAILIPSLVEREHFRDRVTTALAKQISDLDAHDHVKILFNIDNKEYTTGYKRNALVYAARKIGAAYHSFFDDDDLPGETYIKRGLETVESGLDCGSLIGQIYFGGVPGMPFLHSLKYTEWSQDDKFYYRMPNHLNFVNTEKVKDILFPDQVFGEDGQQSYAMRDAGVLKTEYDTKDVLYHYFTGTPKHKL